MRIPRKLLVYFVTFAVSIGASPCHAQGGQKESLLIGPGDLLHVVVFREPNLEQKLRVRDSGDITLELAGRVHVAGSSPAEAAQLVSNAYWSGGYLNHPEVSLSIDEYGTQGVAVLGQVAKPGMVPLTTPLSIIDVLALAGGMTDTAERHITIERASGGGTVNLFLPNLASASLNAGRTMVRPGDKIIVPKAGLVYVLGDVGRPGGYVMQDDSQLTVLQAIALAYGTQRTAAEQNTRLLHKINGVRVETRLPLKAMEQGKKPDQKLAADDIIYVPFSMSKNIALGSASIVSSAGAAAIYTSHP